MVKYDPRQVQKFAQIMYRQATMAVIFWTALGLLFGLIAGIGLVGGAFEIRRLSSEIGGPRVAIALVAGFGGLVGYGIGQGKAFWYRLQAQILLCQSQIEANTRTRAEFPSVQ